MPEAILTDIEGTISSINFVKEILFPYSEERLSDYLIANYERDHRVLKIIDDVLAIENNEAGVVFEAQIYTAIEILLTWIKEDRKIAPLKELQGLIWEEGFRKGLFKSHLYADAYDWLLEVKGKGLPIYVYSSGSVFAQKLFFEHSEYGDIRYLFSGFYDTKIGSKKDADSYLKIAADIKVKPEYILFLSDIEEECAASEQAGFLTVKVDRESKEQNFSETRKIIHNFKELETYI